MASPSSSKSETAIIEQVITEFFAKSVHIILESRSPYVSSRNYSADPLISSPSPPSSSSSFRPRDKWFNLALRDCPAALENFDLWRQSNLEPVVVDVILRDRKSVRNVSFPSPAGLLVRNLSSSGDEFVRENRNEKVVERWIVQYDSQSSSWFTRESSHQGRKKGSRAASHPSEFQVMYKKAYRRIIVLLRSVYAAVRLLPTYKLFRDLNASGQIHPLSLSHRILSVVHPFSREEDAEMNQLGFGPLDTFFGKLSLSVTYLKKIEVVGSEPSTPMSTQFIMDYVGSPLADPLKRFPSLPYAGSAPSCVSLSRRHSWSNDHGETTSFSLTPSPAYSDSRALDRNLNPHLPYPNHLLDTSSLPCSLPKGSYAAYTKNFDEYRPSPPFSPSSSPSPPSHLSKALIRSESAPVSIPWPGQRGRGGGQIHGLPHPYSNRKRQGYPSQADSIGTEPSTTSTPHTFSPEKMLQLNKESFSLMEVQTGVLLPKIFPSGKDHAVNLPILKVPSNTPSHVPSRSSSRLSLMDEFDDSGFSTPFADDDVDVTNSYRVGSADCKYHAGENLGPGELIPIKRSPDAAVGALVRMLRTAPPLQLDNSNTLKSMQASEDEISSEKFRQEKKSNDENDAEKVDSSSCLDITASELSKSRTTADALEELQTYKHMRELILKQGESIVQDIEDAAKSDSGDLTALQ
ncbi:autophagy-related protein 13b [Phalaenopsis equestris]|uniref:autophagy-related protein 13b n=1 Tax=Phalaenopsis equestris TaxID=78828 RepID=UPI0009E49ED5|nr:autophagy-related protein 13b [Phalaenopsis equestris]